MLPQQLPRNGHCLQSTEHRISNRSIRIHRIDSPRIEQLFEQWKQQRRRSNQQQQQLIMDPQKNVVVTKKSEGEDQAALAWLKRCLDVDRLSEYIDRNILAFRVTAELIYQLKTSINFLPFLGQYLPYAVAIAGVAVLLRSIRLVTLSFFPIAFSMETTDDQHPLSTLLCRRPSSAIAARFRAPLYGRTCNFAAVWWTSTWRRAPSRWSTSPSSCCHLSGAVFKRTTTATTARNIFSFASPSPRPPSPASTGCDLM